MEDEGLPPVDVTVVILSFNEAIHIRRAVGNVVDWAEAVFVLDSYSTDGTEELALTAGAQVFQNPFEDYSRQRQHAIDALPYQTEWVMFLDADEWLPDPLKDEIRQRLAGRPSENGFRARRRMIWLGTWIRRGYYGAQMLRLFRRDCARCEGRPINEQLLVEGSVGLLEHDFIDENLKGVSDWIAKHNRYSSFEAAELFSSQSSTSYVAPRLLGNPNERKRWLVLHVWNRLPLLLRPLAIFFYRYVLRGGFLDGRVGLMFHSLQCVWFWFLVGVKHHEIQAGRPAPHRYR